MPIAERGPPAIYLPINRDAKSTRAFDTFFATDGAEVKRNGSSRTLVGLFRTRAETNGTGHLG